METTICQYCHKLVYVGFVEHSRFLFDDPKLQHPHTRTKCQSNQKGINLEGSVKTIQDQIIQLRDEIVKIKEKLGIE